MKRGENLRKHGLTGSPEHKVWCMMMTRCYWNSPSHGDYHLYQGKGITVCPRWHDFANFLADMGPRPSLKHSIDRRNSSLGYSPENCYWATAIQQARNTSRNRRISCDGQTLTLVEWSNLTGLKREIIANRLNRGWSPSRALWTPKISDRERDQRGQYVA